MPIPQFPRKRAQNFQKSVFDQNLTICRFAALKPPKTRKESRGKSRKVEESRGNPRTPRNPGEKSTFCCRFSHFPPRKEGESPRRSSSKGRVLPNYCRFLEGSSREKQATHRQGRGKSRKVEESRGKPREAEKNQGAPFSTQIDLLSPKWYQNTRGRFARINSRELIRRKNPIFITCARFACIASNLRFAKMGFSLGTLK